jgi:hypothetical protein
MLGILHELALRKLQASSRMSKSAEIPGRVEMTCGEFQKVLPYIIDSGGNEEEQKHLETCPMCSDLVADLRYIAEYAKLLVPMEDPSPRVWQGIERSLHREGLAKPARRHV